MLKKLLVSGLFAGFAAGLIAAALQMFFVVPLILEAELYESGEVLHFAGANHDHAAHEHPTIEGGAFDRTLATWLVTLVTYVGFALLLVAGFALSERAGHEPNARSGLLWGLAGFLAFQLAPAAGLPPELPGTAAADLFGRQMWWCFTVLATSKGLAAIAFGGNLGTVVAGIAALALPHIIGAPHPDTYAGVVPPELSALFVSRSLAVSAIIWAAMGAIAGYYWNREA